MSKAKLNTVISWGFSPLINRSESLILETANKSCKYLSLGSKHCLSPEPGNPVEVVTAWHFYICCCLSQPLRDHQLTAVITGPICFPDSRDASRFLVFHWAGCIWRTILLSHSSSSPESQKTLWNRKGSLDIRMQLAPESGWRRNILYTMGKPKARSEAVQVSTLFFPTIPSKVQQTKMLIQRSSWDCFKASNCTTLFFN